MAGRSVNSELERMWKETA